MMPRSFNETEQIGGSHTKCHCPWLPGPDKPHLRRDEIHLWLAFLEAERARFESSILLLTEEERTRAGRFYLRRDRERFVAARSLLRRILARYLGEQPASIRFCRNLHGKPALAGEHGLTGVRFSVSHSQGLALYAVSSGREVGVDLERLRFDRPADEIIRRFFSEEEQARLFSMPERERAVAFFKCWTVKEACLKADGLGIWSGLGLVIATLEGNEARARVPAASAQGQEERWSVKVFEPQPDYVAALAAPGGDWSVKTWKWSEW